MKAMTWDRESHGLYDYESKRITKFENKINKDGELVRSREEVFFDHTKTRPGNNKAIAEEQEDEETCLLKLQKRDGKYMVIPQNENKPNDRLWNVIRSLKEGYVIKKYDIIKLGRMKFRVKEFRTEKEYFEDHDNNKSPHQGFDETHCVKKATETDVMCRFCWTGEQTEENPIIGSCICIGSIQYIHFMCLKQWLGTKVTKKNEGDSHTTLNWKSFECELCKFAYPYTFMLEGKRWFLVDLARPDDNDTPYIIMESLNSEKNTSRTVHTVIINTDQTVFSLGRGHDSELRINDISVSRKHANLEYKNGVFTLTDLKSKFGTLVLLSHNVELNDSNSKTFQIGRTVVTLKSKCEAPWKRGQNRAQNIGYNFDAKDLGRLEALLNDKNNDKEKYAANEQSNR